MAGLHLGGVRPLVQPTLAAVSCLKCLTALVAYTSPRSIPAASMHCHSTAPAGPTNGTPRLSSTSPGCSPTRISARRCLGPCRTPSASCPRTVGNPCSRGLPCASVLMLRDCGTNGAARFGRWRVAALRCRPCTRRLARLKLRERASYPSRDRRRRLATGRRRSCRGGVAGTPSKRRIIKRRVVAAAQRTPAAFEGADRVGELLDRLVALDLEQGCQFLHRDGLLGRRVGEPIGVEHERVAGLEVDDRGCDGRLDHAQQHAERPDGFDAAVTVAK